MTARGEYNTLNVVKRKRVNVEQAKKNFDDLVQIGTNEQFLEYIEKENLLMARNKGFSFDKILFLCKDLQFWKKLIAILRHR